MRKGYWLYYLPKTFNYAKSFANLQDVSIYKVKGY